jgi:hypothetical protein
VTRGERCLPGEEAERHNLSTAPPGLPHRPGPGHTWGKSALKPTFLLALQNGLLIFLNCAGSGGTRGNFRLWPMKTSLATATKASQARSGPTGTRGKVWYHTEKWDMRQWLHGQGFVSTFSNDYLFSAKERKIATRDFNYPMHGEKLVIWQQYPTKESRGRKVNIGTSSHRQPLQPSQNKNWKKILV